jgi:thiol-disulfide isomerase/thioredoxin
VIVGLVLSTPVMVLTQTVKAPALILKDTRGRTFRLADHHGKVVLINFWATWCPPCRAEIPELIKWQRQYRSLGLQIVAITYPPEKLSRVRNFGTKLKINYPLALGTKATKRLFTSSETLPLTFVVDRTGNIVEIIEGTLLPEEFENKVKPLLQLKITPPQRTARPARFPAGYVSMQYMFHLTCSTTKRKVR